MLADADQKEENISKFIDPGLVVANMYYNKMGDMDAYIITMCELIPRCPKYL
jgi:hypothetical protein